MLIAADVGGTKTTVAAFNVRGGRLEKIRGQTFASEAYDSLEDILAAFRDPEPRTPIERACFGVAGPVIDARVTLTNLGWLIEERALSEILGCPVRLLNDLQAAAYGILELGDDDFRVLQEGVPSDKGTIALLAAGTGLGEAMLVWDGSRYRALASEGGHADFAPRNALEADLLWHLGARHGGHVSYERVLSGPGLVELYRFLRARSGIAEPRWLTERLEQEDPSAAIGKVGIDNHDEVCTRALEMFASIYGAEAGNLALKCFATAGVVVAGGIAPKILPVLEGGGFEASFNDKGRYRAFTERVPVKVALNAEAPLVGAAHHALTI